MAVTAVTVFQMSAKYPTLPVSGSSLNNTFTTAVTAADGISFPLTGREIIIVKGGAASHNITVTSVADDKKRTGDIVYGVGIGLFAILPQIPVLGFQQSNGTCVITIDAGGTDVGFMVLRLTD